MFGIKLKLDSRKISSWLFFDPICIMGGAKRRQSGGTSGRISLMSSLPVDGTSRAHENRRHCSRPDFAPCLPGVTGGGRRTGDGRRKGGRRDLYDGGKPERNSKRQGFVICYCLHPSKKRTQQRFLTSI